MSAESDRYQQLCELLADARATGDPDKIAELENDLSKEFPGGPPCGEATKL
jgi:hypothetical protein